MISMRVIQAKEWIFEGIEKESFVFSRRNSTHLEKIVIQEAKYIVLPDVVVFFRWIKDKSDLTPYIEYSYSTQRRIASGQIDDPGILLHLAKLGVA